MEMRRVAFSRKGYVVFGLVPLLLAVLSASSLATMPAPPLSIWLDLGGPAAVGEDVELRLEAKPLVDAPRLRLTITLPDGVELIQGEPRWEGSVRAGESRILTVTIRPRDAVSHVIQGAAQLQFPDGTILGDARSLVLPLGPQGREKPSAKPLKKTSRGEPVIEY